MGGKPLTFEELDKTLTKIDIKGANGMDNTSDLLELVGRMVENHSENKEKVYNNYTDMTGILADKNALPISKLEQLTEVFRNDVSVLKQSVFNSGSASNALLRVDAVMVAICDTLSETGCQNFIDVPSDAGLLIYAKSCPPKEEFANICYNLDIIIELLSKDISDFDYASMNGLRCAFWYIHEMIKGYFICAEKCKNDNTNK